MNSKNVIIFFTCLAGVSLLFLVLKNSFNPNKWPDSVPKHGGIEAVTPNQDINIQMQKFAEQVVIDAWKYNHIVLDYSPNSVKDVEKIMGLRKKWMERQKFSEKDKLAEALLFGAYIGEVIRREKGGKWAEGDDVNGPGSYPLFWKGKRRSYPYIWCEKRLFGGSEDNVWNKYYYTVNGKSPFGVKMKVVKSKVK